jgi:hypothetical protein
VQGRQTLILDGKVAGNAGNTHLQSPPGFGVTSCKSLQLGAAAWPVTQADIRQRFCNNKPTAAAPGCNWNLDHPMAACSTDLTEGSCAKKFFDALAFDSDTLAVRSSQDGIMEGDWVLDVKSVAYDCDLLDSDASRGRRLSDSPLRGMVETRSITKHSSKSVRGRALEEADANTASSRSAFGVVEWKVRSEPSADHSSVNHTSPILDEEGFIHRLTHIDEHVDDVLSKVTSLVGTLASLDLTASLDAEALAAITELKSAVGDGGLTADLGKIENIDTLEWLEQEMHALEHKLEHMHTGKNTSYTHAHEGWNGPADPKHDHTDQDTKETNAIIFAVVLALACIIPLTVFAFMAFSKMNKIKKAQEAMAAGKPVPSGARYGYGYGPHESSGLLVPRKMVAPGHRR